jgi:hypothetical protein
MDVKTAQRPDTPKKRFKRIMGKLQTRRTRKIVVMDVKLFSDARIA